MFLLGPRKCGKTFALCQIENDCEKAERYDFKELRDESESMQLVDMVIQDILSGIDKVYLLDEVTYAFYPESELVRIANAYTSAKARSISIQTKIVFTGSQSLALASWGQSAFGNQAIFLKADFLSYAEWLDYEEREDVSSDSYCDFVKGTSRFYNFTTVEDYLKACLDETVKSNAKSRNYIYGNDCDLVDVDTLVNIMYITMFTLHDTSSVGNFFVNDKFYDKMVYLSKTIIKRNPMCSEDIRDKIAQSFVGRYESVKATDIETLKQSFSFLIRSGLITATPIFDDFNHNVNVLKNLEDSDGCYKKKSDLLGHVNFTINYPMFYMELVKEIFPGDYDKCLEGMLLGSIVECHVRGLLPSNSIFEYHDEDGREIDYINRVTRTAIEIMVTNKRIKGDVYLDLLSEGGQYTKILLSKDRSGEEDGIHIIPFYQFIYENSIGRSYKSSMADIIKSLHV